MVIALGDVAGKGSPAALLMAILLAMLRTLLDEGLDAERAHQPPQRPALRHAPSSRFITLQFVNLDPATGDLVAVNAGHLPALIRRRNGEFERLSEGGIALGMFDSSQYTAQRSRLEPGDLLVLYSDGITEAESPSGTPFDEEGLISLISAHAGNPSLVDIGKAGDQGRRVPRPGRALRGRFHRAAGAEDGRTGFGVRDSGFERLGLG